jgi:protein disulfide-isomerase A1
MISTIRADSLEDFKNASDVVVVGYFAPDDKASHEAFTLLADSMRDGHLFGVVADDALAKAEKIIIPGVAVYKAFDGGKNVFQLTPGLHAMSAMLKDAGHPLVVEFLPELHDDYINVRGEISYRDFRTITNYAFWAGIPLGYREFDVGIST